MSSRNEHHAFERIATRIARQRISSNILLANGPVSARGDQQRDAESYWTRKPSELPLARAAGAALSADPVVLAYTVQKTGLKAKVLSDVAGICAPGTEPVERIAFYSVANIEAGLAHELQRTAHEAHDVRLQIFSGEQVATLLAEPDLIWVATHYLSLPNHLVPRLAPDLHPPQYRALLERLRISDGPELLTPGTQSEIRDCLRYATWNREANADLPEWLDYMVKFTDEDENLTHDGVEFGDLAFNACYEIVMARLHGTGSVTRAEDLYREALGYALSVDRPSVTEDAVILVSSWADAWRRGRTSAGAQEIAQSQKRLRAQVGRQLDGLGPTVYPGHRARLVAALVTLSLVPDCVLLERRYGPPPAELDSGTGGPADVSVFDAAAFVQWADLDVDEIMGQLRGLVELLPASRSFPIERVAGTFQLFADSFRHHPDYRLVRDALDDAVVLVRGDSARAERSHERARAALNVGRPLEALGELHDAKASWLHGDTMRGAIQVMRLIGRIYASLGLMYAAKQYSLTAASLAVADSDHDTAHYRLSQNPSDYDEHVEYSTVETNATLGLMAIRTLWPRLEKPFVETFGDNSWIEVLTAVADEIGEQYTMTEADFQEQAAQDMAGPVLGDLGQLRIIDFRALGGRWRLTFRNNLTTVLTAEALCAVLQVTLAEMAPHEPVLAPVTVDVLVEVVPGGDRSVHELRIDDSGPHIRGRVTLPDAEGVAASEHVDRLMSHVFSLIGVVSPRPAPEFTALVDSLLAVGRHTKVEIFRPYEVANGLLEESHYERCAALEPPAGAATFDPATPEAL